MAEHQFVVGKYSCAWKPVLASPAVRLLNLTFLLEFGNVGLRAFDEGEELLTLCVSLAITAVGGKPLTRNPVCVTWFRTPLKVSGTP